MSDDARTDAVRREFATALDAADLSGHFHGWYTEDDALRPSGWVDGHTDSVADALRDVGWGTPVEVDRLRARVAELETAGDRVADELDRSTGISDPDVQGLVQAWRAVRGER